MPAENRKTRIKFYNVLMLILAVLAIVLTILFAPRGARRAFQVSVDSMLSLLAEDPIQEELTILFEDQPVPNLIRLDFTAMNTGKEPILEEDVKQFPTISLEGDGQILDVRVLSKQPLNLGEELLIDDTTSSFSLYFPLMNAGDFARFCVYYAGILRTAPLISARIAGIDNLVVVDNTTVGSPRSVTLVRWWEILFWVVGGLCIALGGYLLRQIRRQKHLEKRIDEDGILDSLKSAEDVKEFVRKQLGFAPSEVCDNIVRRAASVEMASEEKRSEVLSMIQDLVHHDSSNIDAIPGAVIFLIPGLILLLIRMV